MCLLLETIKIENRTFFNLPYHERRMNLARRNVHGCRDQFDLEGFLHLPGWLDHNRYKCRIEYADRVRKVEFAEYTAKKIRSLKLVNSGPFDYQYKYADRSALEALRDRRAECDDIVIAVDNRITDSSYSNLAFYDGEAWHTPRLPLLRGTKREQLLYDGVLKESDIHVSDLSAFLKVSLINAMLEIGEVELEIESIIR